MFNPTTTTRDQNEHGNPGDTLTYAHEYLDRGFVPIPVEFKSKACTLKDWPNFRCNHDELKALFRPPCNIGVVLGQRSGGLVDIDLDCEEAIALAPHMLPPTGMIFGRQSRPSSHWIYKVPDPGKRIQFADLDGSMLAELRAEHCMTVFPGSIHESGEEVCFDLNGAPAEIEFAQLACFVRQLAAAALLLRQWKKGSRHRLALVLSGTLLNGGMSEENARRVLEALVNAADDGEREDRLKCLSDTVGRLKSGEPVSSRNDLAEIIGEATTNRVCEWLGLGPARNGLVLRQAGVLQAPYGGSVPESDIANAERFTVRNRIRARYSYGQKKWFVWDGCRWAIDADGEIDRLVSDTVREMAKE